MQKKGISIACKNKKEELYIYYENSQKKDLITKNITEITKQNIIDFKLVLIKKLPRKLNDKIDYQTLQ